MNQLKASPRLFRILFCCLFAIIFSNKVFCQSDSIVRNVNWANGTRLVSIAGNIIAPDSLSAPVEITDSANVDFVSGTEITLKPGFHCGALSTIGYFQAKIDRCNLLQISMTSDTDIILNDTITLNAFTDLSRVPSYLWSTGDTVYSIKVSPQDSMYYSVTITDASGCRRTAHTSVNVFAPGFAALIENLDGGFYSATNGKIYFDYVQTYNDSVNKLNYNVYDSTSAIVESSSSQQLSVQYGFNNLNLDVSALAHGFYILEAINPKGEKLYLRFLIQ